MYAVLTRYYCIGLAREYPAFQAQLTPFILSSTHHLDSEFRHSSVVRVVAASSTSLLRTLLLHLATAEKTASLLQELAGGGVLLTTSVVVVIVIASAVAAANAEAPFFLVSSAAGAQALPDKGLANLSLPWYQVVMPQGVLT